MYNGNVLVCHIASVSLCITANSEFGVNYLYQKYGIDSIQLIQSDKYYSKNPRIYSRIYKKVLDKMQMQKDSIDRLIDTK